MRRNIFFLFLAIEVAAIMAVACVKTSPSTPRNPELKVADLQPATPSVNAKQTDKADPGADDVKPRPAPIRTQIAELMIRETELFLQRDAAGNDDEKAELEAEIANVRGRRMQLYQTQTETQP